jgi:hypothetical protein
MGGKINPGVVTISHGRSVAVKRTGTYFTGAWMGLGVGLEDCVKYCAIGVPSPNRLARREVAISTELSRPFIKYVDIRITYYFQKNSIYILTTSE